MRIRDVRSGAARGGYTLIELLVVIAIIGVLMGLLLSGVMAVLAARDRAGNQFDLGKLGQSMDVALNKYENAKSLPGYLVLYNNTDVYRRPSAYLTTAADIQDAERSRDVLRKMFKARFISDAGVVPWDGTNGGAVTNKVVLEGHQCLVFYLGGAADVSGAVPKMTGFSSNPVNPLAPGGTDRIGPFYNFEGARLTKSAYPAYLDRFGTPFAYFGGTGGSNAYVGGCPSIGIASPYPDAKAGRYMNPDSFQLISAGRDKAFGDPTKWNPSTGSTDPRARDDVSNFSSSALTNPQN